MSAELKSKDYAPYTVFHFENYSRPENHYYIWVMTDRSGNGKCIHVVAPDGALEFTFEVKDLRPEDSINIENWIVLGTISESQYYRLLHTCENAVTVPVKDGISRPHAVVGDCRTWVDEAVQKLRTEGIL